MSHAQNIDFLRPQREKREDISRIFPHEKSNASIPIINYNNHSFLFLHRAQTRTKQNDRKIRKMKSGRVKKVNATSDKSCRPFIKILYSNFNVITTDF